MSYLICEKHNRIEKLTNKLTTNAHICMNKYCPDSFQIFCAACKNDHRDHAIKILTIQDITFLVERLLKTPFKQVTKYVNDSLDVMKKLKLIKDFRRKIDILERETHQQALKLIEYTQSLIHEYAVCKQNVTELSDILTAVQQQATYAEFQKNSKELLQNLDYNFKKDKFEYGNAVIKEKEDKRRKSFDNARRKIEEVKDYSMKIIEVILSNDDSQSDGQDMNYKKKQYENLKEELSLERDSYEKGSQTPESNKTMEKSPIKTPLKKKTLDIMSQTNNEWINKLQQTIKQLQAQLSEHKIASGKAESDAKLKITNLTKQKDNLSKQVAKYKEKLDEKRKKMIDIEAKLRKNKEARLQKQKIKDDLFSKIVEISQWKGLSQPQKV